MLVAQAPPEAAVALDRALAALRAHVLHVGEHARAREVEAREERAARALVLKHAARDRHLAVRAVADREVDAVARAEARVGQVADARGARLVHADLKHERRERVRVAARDGASFRSAVIFFRVRGSLRTLGRRVLGVVRGALRLRLEILEQGGEGHPTARASSACLHPRACWAASGAT